MAEEYRFCTRECFEEYVHEKQSRKLSLIVKKGIEAELNEPTRSTSTKLLEEMKLAKRKVPRRPM